MIAAAAPGLPTTAASGRGSAAPESGVPCDGGTRRASASAARAIRALLASGRSTERSTLTVLAPARTVAQHTRHGAVDTVVDVTGRPATSAVRASNGDAHS